MSLVRVFEMPEFSGGFRFGGGQPETFIEVDWFRDDPQPFPTPSFATQEGRAEIAEYLLQKVYIKPGRAYLVLHPEHSFTIGYEAP